MKHTLAFIMMAVMAISVQAAERMVLVTRHCQSGSDIRPIEDDGGITPLGIKQAQNLGQELKRLGFKGRIYASPYYRTVATACHAASQCGGSVYPDARVQERVAREGGNLAKGGATLEQLKGLFPAQIAADAVLAFPWMLTTPEEYEGSQQVRLEKALDEILAEVPDQDIMIVSHAGAVAALNRIIGKRCGKEITGTTWNCALYKYTVSDDKTWQFKGYDIAFMAEEDVTANQKARLIDQKKVNAPAVVSGVDAGVSYNFFMLSDTHFGDPESYDMNPETNPKFKTRKDIKRANKAMAVYEALFAQMAKNATPETKFVISCGDLIEGGGFNADTHAVQLQKAVDLVKNSLKMPFYPVNGNHDSWGNGGPEAFRRVVVDVLAKETKTPMTATNYTMTVGPDLFVFGDWFSPGSDGMKYLKETLKAITKKPRYLFVVVHPNLIPSTSASMSQWCEILADFDAIVLCGHSHQTQLVDYERDGKKITQLIMATFLYPDVANNHYAPPREDLARFWASFEKSRVGKPKHQTCLDEQWKPYVKRVWWTYGNGMAQLLVSDEGVDAVIQSADITQPPFKIKVR